jgi:hypothetical protein
MSYTYAVLGVSGSTFEEIAAKLRAAGYHHCFDGEVIDMHGIALKKEDEECGPTASQKER